VGNVSVHKVPFNGKRLMHNFHPPQKGVSGGKVKGRSGREEGAEHNFFIPIVCFWFLSFNTHRGTLGATSFYRVIYGLAYTFARSLLFYFYSRMPKEISFEHENTCPVGGKSLGMFGFRDTVSASWRTTSLFQGYRGSGVALMSSHFHG
jgi:hypothetical protein